MGWPVTCPRADDDYDYSQELLASGYADMLHDEERNVAYEAAINDAVAALGPDAHVLDIGTGTLPLLCAPLLRSSAPPLLHFCTSARLQSCSSTRPLLCYVKRCCRAKGCAMMFPARRG